jgi:hypothetical protein
MVYNDVKKKVTVYLLMIIVGEILRRRGAPVDKMMPDDVYASQTTMTYTKSD